MRSSKWVHRSTASRPERRYRWDDRMWPDAEGEAGYQVVRVNVKRLRQFLDDKDTIELSGATSPTILIVAGWMCGPSNGRWRKPSRFPTASNRPWPFTTGRFWPSNPIPPGHFPCALACSANSSTPSCNRGNDINSRGTGNKRSNAIKKVLMRNRAPSCFTST